MITLYSALDTSTDRTQVVACGIYAHGELEEQLGYDVVCPRYTELPNHNYILTDIKEDGIYDIIVQKDDLKISARLYYWYLKDFNGRHRGLCVLPEDTESVQYAENRFNKREWGL
jgi:hypothetical protein